MQAQPPLSTPPAAQIAYTVQVAEVSQKRYRIQVQAEGLRRDTITFQLPAWTPGWYVLRSNEGNLSNFSARGPSQKPLRLQQTDVRTWTVTTEGASRVTFSYDVRASDTDFGFFEPYLDSEHGFVPGPATLAYIAESKESPCTITYQVPEGWKVASANTPVPGKPTTFSAPNYDALTDQPAELGKFTRIERTLGDVPVSVVIVGGDSTRYARWAESVFKIAQAGIKLLGGAPFERYIFFFHFARTESFTGGLEHLNGTVIRLDPNNLRQPDPENLAIVAHEFVHAWNVKRLRPAALGPFDYTRAVRVKDLWFAEGVTDYFAPRVLTEAGLASQRFWLGYQAEQLTQLMTNPARRRVTLEDASSKVWESQDESQGFGGLSYYNKGLVVGLLLDIELRQKTNNKVGLEDVLKTLLAQCLKTGKGYSEGEIERVATRLAGADLSAFFNRALRSTDELPIVELLAAGGIQADESIRKNTALGATWDFSQPSQARIASVDPSGPAAQAGLQGGDVVLSLGGQAIDSLLGGALTRYQPGERLPLTFWRDGAIQQGSLTLGAETEHSYRLRPLPRPTPLQARILASLSGTGSGS
nr:PDZ domain-containing protein [Armatimonas sp.]